MINIPNTPLYIDSYLLINELKNSFLRKLNVEDLDSLEIDSETNSLYRCVLDHRGNIRTKEIISVDERYVELFKAINILQKCWGCL